MSESRKIAESKIVNRKPSVSKLTVQKFVCSRSALLVSLIATLFTASAAMAKDATFVVDDPKHRDRVSFTSDAPIELIEGKTDAIKGTVTLDDSFDLKKPAKVHFEVDLATIDTGIALRNEHMRTKFLQTDKYPKAVFDLTTYASSVDHLKETETATINAKGKLTLHGKTVVRDIPVKVTYFDKCKGELKNGKACQILEIKATFKVPFKDHDIERPEIVFQKLADTVVVTISAAARRAI
jgi:polyisoprenoid-binding protein YceI